MSHPAITPFAIAMAIAIATPGDPTTWNILITMVVIMTIAPDGDR